MPIPLLKLNKISNDLSHKKALAVKQGLMKY